jgi:hypothetical protein
MEQGGGEGGDVAKIKYKKKVDLKGDFFFYSAPKTFVCREVKCWNTY